MLGEPPSIRYEEAQTETRAEAKEMVTNPRRQCIRSERMRGETIWWAEMMLAYIVAQRTGPRVVAVGMVSAGMKALSATDPA
jgi:hypothetical protein